MVYSIEIRAPAEMYDVLVPEQTASTRFSVQIQKKKETIISITAADATALKAITTSVLKLIEIAEKIK